MEETTRMLENLQFFTIIVLCYCWPLILAYIIIKVYRKYVDHGSYMRNFVSGIVWIIGVREVMRNFRFKKRR